MSDNVNHPKHYADTTSIECIEAMEIAFGTEATVNFCKCNAFKYVWRYKNKNGKEDLEKAMWYLDKAVDLRKDDETQDGQIITLLNLIQAREKEFNDGDD